MSALHHRNTPGRAAAIAPSESGVDPSCPRYNGVVAGPPEKLQGEVGGALGLDAPKGQSGDSMTEIKHSRPERFFSDRFNVTPNLMERLLGSNLAGKVDDADIYLEYRVNEELVLEENVVKKASRHVSQGAGVRAQSGTRTGYAHTDDLAVGNLEEAARQARAIADRAGDSAVVAVPSRGRPHDLYNLVEPPIVTELARKLELLRKVDAATRAADARVKQVIATL